MRRIVGGIHAFREWLQSFAIGLGAPGLFFVAFLDSSFLSLPEINDLLVVYLVTRNKASMVVYATAATLGSICGCLVLYVLGRKGGEALVRRRFGGGRVDRALASVRRYGVIAVLIPSLLPPPAPFKIFVLLAGVAGIKPARFALAIGVGRGTRYFTEGFLAIRYGDQALEYFNKNATVVAAALVGLLLLGLLGYLVWSKARARQDR